MKNIVTHLGAGCMSVLMVCVPIASWIVTLKTKWEFQQFTAFCLLSGMFTLVAIVLLYNIVIEYIKKS